MPARAVTDWIIANALALVAALALLFALGFAWQSVRIDGLRLPLIGTVVKGLTVENAELRARVHDLEVASELAAAKARLDKERREATNQAITERTNNAQLREIRSELDNARAHIAANRVRQGSCDHRSGPAAAAEDRGPGFDAGTGALPAMDGVLVSESDVMICTENTVKARAWRDWGLAISAASQE